MSDQPQSSSKVERTVKDFTAGWIGGIAQVLSGQPFDTIKVRLQTQSHLYSSPLECLSTTVRNEGPLALYKGTLTPLLGIGVCVSIQFGVLEQMKRFFKDMNERKHTTDSVVSGSLSKTQFFASGATAMWVNSFVLGPIEHIRIRMQIQNSQTSSVKFNGPFDCIRKIYQQHGIRGLYIGQPVTMLRETIGGGFYFLTYEYLCQQAVKRTNHENVRELPKWMVLLFGAAAGVMFWVPVFPADVIKSKLQSDDFDNRKYKGGIDAVIKTYQSEGIRGFYRGFSPCLLRSAPVNACTFFAFELAMRALG